MGHSERWFRVWRAWLWVLACLLILVLLGLVIDGSGFGWTTCGLFALAMANLGSGYFGFARKRLLAVILATVWTLLDLLFLVVAVLIAFIEYVVSTGNWNFGAVH